MQSKRADDPANVLCIYVSNIPLHDTASRDPMRRRDPNAGIRPPERGGVRFFTRLRLFKPPRAQIFPPSDLGYARCALAMRFCALLCALCPAPKFFDLQIRVCPRCVRLHRSLMRSAPRCALLCRAVHRCASLCCAFRATRACVAVAFRATLCLLPFSLREKRFKGCLGAATRNLSFGHKNRLNRVSERRGRKSVPQVGYRDSVGLCSGMGYALFCKGVQQGVRVLFFCACTLGKHKMLF